MPSFTSPFVNNNLEKTLSKDEIIRSLRFAISAEQEAIHIYQQIINACTIPSVKKVLGSIVDEERVHIGEIMMLLFKLDPTEKKMYEKGFLESRDIIQRRGYN